MEAGQDRTQLCPRAPCVRDREAPWTWEHGPCHGLPGGIPLSRKLRPRLIPALAMEPWSPMLPGISAHVEEWVSPGGGTGWADSPHAERLTTVVVSGSSAGTSWLWGRKGTSPLCSSPGPLPSPAPPRQRHVEGCIEVGVVGVAQQPSMRVWPWLVTPGGV